MSSRAICVLAACAMVLPATAATAVVATTSYSAAEEGPHPKAINIRQTDAGHVLTVRLTGLAKGTRIHRAALRCARGKLEDPAGLLEPIRIYPSPRPAGRPLRLLPPDFNAFDVAEPVRWALAAGGELKLLVKRFPGFLPARTRLDVTYAGRPTTVPPAVTGLKVFHRAGQTFITWKEVDPLITAPKATWGEIRRKLAGAGAACTYRIYAHTKPINAATFAQATLLGEVGPLSCWNVNGRNLEYLIGRAMVKSDRLGELAEDYNQAMYRWGPDHPRMDRYPVPRLVIDEKVGPLPPGTGLYVHSPPAPGRRYYAVVTCRAGVENTVDFGPGNATAKPVNETVGPGLPVRQGQGLWGPFFDYPGKRWVYVQWTGGPQTRKDSAGKAAAVASPRPNMYFNWSVLIPPDIKPGQKVPAELYLHTGNFSYAKPRQKYILKSIQLAPHDWPFSGWYGFNEAYGTLRAYRPGVVRDYTHRRILAFLDWALKTFPIDPSRIVLTGSDGAALLALHHPRRFAYVLVNNFSNYALWGAKLAELAVAWGPKCPEIKDAAGRGNWGWAMLDQLVLADPARDLPLIYCRGYSWGPFVRGFAKGEGRFYSAMRKANQPIVADWTWASGQLVRPDRYTGLWRGLDITNTTPIPAFANCSTDQNREANGQTNLPMRWGEIKDAPEGVQIVISNPHGCTVDLAFRRLGKFKPRAGEKLRWEAISAKPRCGPTPPPQSGTVRAGAHGLVVLRRLKLAPGSELTVKVARAR